MKNKVRFSLAVGLCAASLAAQTEKNPLHAHPEREVGELELEELLAIEVSSVSRKEESLFDTAGAVGVLTEDEIRRTGVTLLPEALRYANGVHVANFTSRGWAISIRGFNEDSANKLEVRMDGRSLYTPFFSGVLWDHTDYVLEDLERIEIMRGPAGAMWGANAMNGVINIRTKGSEETTGGLLRTLVAAPERFVQSARLGFQLDDNLYGRVYTKYYSIDDKWFESGEKSRFDETEMLRTGFRTDYLPEEGARLLIEGEVYTDKLGLNEDGFPSLDGGFLLARWEKEVDNVTSYQLQAYYDRYDRLYLGSFQETRDTAETSGQFRYQGVRNHDFVAGASYRRSWDETMQVSIPRLEPADEAFGIASVFAQDEIRLTHETDLLLGAALEHNSLVDRWEFQPSARASWSPSDRSTTWAAVSRAVRTPARVDTDLVWDVPGLEFRANRSHKSEEAISYELGQRYRWGDEASVQASLFYTDYDDLPSTEPQGRNVYFYENLQEGRTAGGEVAIEYAPTYWSKFTLSYAHLDETFHLEPESAANPKSEAASLGNNPEHLATFGAFLELPKQIEASGYLRYVGELPDPAVPDYLVMDLRLAWAPRPGLEFSLVGRNLLDHRHPEFHAASVFRREISRSIQAQASLEF